jgi:hypothetical protein
MSSGNVIDAIGAARTAFGVLHPSLSQKPLLLRREMSMIQVRNA